VRQGNVILQQVLRFFSMTLPMGSLLGIPLRVHLVLLLFLPWFAWSLYIPEAGPIDGAAYVLMFIGILYGSVMAHEFGHAWGCRLVGGRTEQIIMTPVGGIHMGTGGMESPRSELIVVALGPAVSGVLALLGHGVDWLLSGFQTDNRALILGLIGVSLVAWINTMLFLFNMLTPLLPMDCARLIRALFSLRYNPQLVTMRLAQVGIGLSIFIVAAAILNAPLPLLGAPGPWLAIIAILGLQYCLWELQAVKHGSVYERADNWGGAPVYYDRELVYNARERARQDLRSLFFWKGTKSAKRSRRATPARVIEVIRPRDPEKETDPDILRAMMVNAAEAEDFALAARIKQRLKQLGEE
jgi:Zn-dependent protease